MPAELNGSGSSTIDDHACQLALVPLVPCLQPLPHQDLMTLSSVMRKVTLFMSDSVSKGTNCLVSTHEPKSLIEDQIDMMVRIRVSFLQRPPGQQLRKRQHRLPHVQYASFFLVNVRSINNEPPQIAGRQRVWALVSREAASAGGSL